MHNFFEIVILKWFFFYKNSLVDQGASVRQVHFGQFSLINHSVIQNCGFSVLISRTQTLLLERTSLVLDWFLNHFLGWFLSALQSDLIICSSVDPFGLTTKCDLFIEVTQYLENGLVV